MRGDAVQTVPTVEEEMAKFSGFSTSDGATITKETPEDLNPVQGKNTTAKEDAAAAAREAAKVASPVVKQAALTDEESEAALNAAETAAGKELDPKEAAAALAAARAEKNKPPAGTPPKKSVQERINQSIRHQRTAERERDTERARAAALEVRIAALERGDTKALTGDTNSEIKVAAGGPDPSKFPFGELDAGYIRALSRFETAQAIAEDRENQKTIKLTAEQQEAAEKFEADKAVFEDKGAERYEDFEEVVMQGARDKVWPLSNALGALLFESEHGPEVAYELASDPKLAKEIFGKSVLRQAAWLGQREAEITAGSGAKTAEELAAAKAEAKAAGKSVAAVKVTKAPAPVAQARGQGSNSETPGDTQDFRAFEAAYMGRKT